MPDHRTVVHVHTQQEVAKVLHTLAAMRGTSIRAVVEDWATKAAIDAGLSEVEEPPTHIDSVEVEWTYANESGQCLIRHLPVVVDQAITDGAAVLHVDLVALRARHRDAAIGWLRGCAGERLHVLDSSVMVTETLITLLDDLTAGIDQIQGCEDERADLLHIAARCEEVAARAKERAAGVVDPVAMTPEEHEVAAERERALAALGL